MLKKGMGLVLCALLSPMAALASEGEALFKSKPCVACHKVDAKLLGPSFQEVAAKYAGSENAAQTLAANIKGGSAGQWGPIPMPPNAVSEEEALILANWVLSQK